MKKIWMLMLFSTALLTSYGQERIKEIRDKIETRKIAYMSAKLELTPESAQKFWPLYNSYQDGLKSIHEANRPLMENGEDAEPGTVLDAMIRNEEAVLNLKKEYVGKFRQAIGADKTVKFFRLEREFKEQMLRGIGDRRRQMRQRRGGG